MTQLSSCSKIHVLSMKTVLNKTTQQLHFLSMHQISTLYISFSSFQYFLVDCANEVLKYFVDLLYHILAQVTVEKVALTSSSR